MNLSNLLFEITHCVGNIKNDYWVINYSIIEPVPSYCSSTLLQSALKYTVAAHYFSLPSNIHFLTYTFSHILYLSWAQTISFVIYIIPLHIISSVLHTHHTQTNIHIKTHINIPFNHHPFLTLHSSYTHLTP